MLFIPLNPIREISYVYDKNVDFLVIGKKGFSPYWQKKKDFLCLSKNAGPSKQLTSHLVSQLSLDRVHYTIANHWPRRRGLRVLPRLPVIMIIVHRLLCVIGLILMRVSQGYISISYPSSHVSCIHKLTWLWQTFTYHFTQNFVLYID